MTASTKTMPVYLAIVSGKGGVGKSTVAANLAVSLAERNYKVGLIDADIYGFSLPSLMGVRNKPESAGEKLQPVNAMGVRLMSSGFLREDNQPVIMLGRVIRTFVNGVDWGDLDYLLFDLPPGTGDIPLDLHDLLSAAGGLKELVVTTPHETAAEVAFRAGAMTERTGHEIVGVVENMAYMHCPDCSGRIHAFGRAGGSRLCEALRSELLVQLPLEAPNPNTAAPGLYEASSEAGGKFRELADKVIARTWPYEEKKHGAEQYSY